VGGWVGGGMGEGNGGWWVRDRWMGGRGMGDGWI
jgi:hypothetical protein